MRWDELTVERESEQRLPGYRDPAAVRTFEAPEAMGVRFYEVLARSAINKVPGGGGSLHFSHTINPYRGCTHGCVQCFARPTHEFLGFGPGRDFSREIVVKINVAECVRAELRKPGWKGGHVALGTNTDPYQWVEGRYRLMPGIWEAMIDHRNPCSVLTRSPLLLRDIELFRRLVEVTDFAANLSVPTIDERTWRQTEPHTPNPMKRIEAVAELNRAGIPCGVLVAPLMPGINDQPEQVERILELCAEAGATRVGGIPLHLKGSTRAVFMDWMRDQRPELVERYEKLYDAGRGGHLPPSERRRLTALAGPEPMPGRRELGTDRRSAGEPGERQEPGSNRVPNQAEGSRAGGARPVQTALF